MKFVLALLLMLLIITANFTSADDDVPAPPPAPPTATVTLSPQQVPEPPQKDPPPPLAPPVEAPVTILPEPPHKDPPPPPAPPVEAPVTILGPAGVVSVVTLPPTRVMNGKPYAQVTTITSTSYSVLQGEVETITSTIGGVPTTILSTKTPSGTVQLLQPIESPVDSQDSTSALGVKSAGSSDSLNVNGLRGIGMSIAAVFLNMFYALFA